MISVFLIFWVMNLHIYFIIIEIIQFIQISLRNLLIFSV